MTSLKDLKVVFMGTPAFAVPTLKALGDARCQMKGVVTQPDRPAGRGRKLTISPVKTLSLEEKYPLFQPEKIRDEIFIKELKSLSADVIVVVAYGRILPKEILDMPPMGCINVHASLLPAYRGAAPINWALVRGEKISGVTTMVIDKGLDTGDMLLKKTVDIDESDNAETLYAKLSDEGAALLIETLAGLKDGSLEGIRQDDSLSTYAPSIKKEDGLIDWTNSSEDIVNLVRGLLPWPVAYTKIRGKGLKIFKAEKRGGAGEPGKVIKLDENYLEVAAGKGSVAICELQLEGKKRMPAADLLRGFKIGEGDMLGGGEQVK